MTQDENPYAPVDAHGDAAGGAQAIWLDPPQTVRYRYSAELLTAFWTHRTLTSPSEQRLRRQIVWRRIGLIAAIAVLVAALAWLADLSLLIAAPLVGALLFTAAFSYNATQPGKIQWAYAHAANRLLDETANEHFLSERVLTVDEQGIRQQLPASESFTQWRAFERIERTDDFAFFYESSFTAIVVPRSAFVTRGQFVGFVELARRLWHAARADDQPSPNAEAV